MKILNLEVGTEFMFVNGWLNRWFDGTATHCVEEQAGSSGNLVKCIFNANGSTLWVHENAEVNPV